jgi:hypothetical protein
MHTLSLSLFHTCSYTLHKSNADSIDFSSMKRHLHFDLISLAPIANDYHAWLLVVDVYVYAYNYVRGCACVSRSTSKSILVYCIHKHCYNTCRSSFVVNNMAMLSCCTRCDNEQASERTNERTNEQTNDDRSSNAVSRMRASASDRQ